MHLRDLRGRFDGHDVWVLGSGATLNHVDPRFFDDKKVVACNYVAVALGLTGDVVSGSNYHDPGDPSLWSVPMVAPVADVTGASSSRLDIPGLYQFTAGPQRYAAFDAARDWPTGDDQLVVGPSSIHLCMHLAAYLGAKAIILAGVDCGELDSGANVDTYNDPTPQAYPYNVQAEALPAVADQIRSRYSIGVHSLNPFVNLALEGHSFTIPGSLRIN